MLYIVRVYWTIKTRKEDLKIAVLPLLAQFESAAVYKRVGRLYGLNCYKIGTNTPGACHTPFLGGLLETLDGLLKVSGLVLVIFVHHEMF